MIWRCSLAIMFTICVGNRTSKRCWCRSYGGTITFEVGVTRDVQEPATETVP